MRAVLEETGARVTGSGVLGIQRGSCARATGALKC